MKRENSFVGRGKKREELRKWTILLLLFAGLAVLGYCLDRFAPSPDDVLGPAVQTTTPSATDAYRKTIQVKIEGNISKPGIYTLGKALGLRIWWKRQGACRRAMIKHSCRSPCYLNYLMVSLL